MRKYALLWSECEDDPDNEDGIKLIGPVDGLAVIETDEDCELEAENTAAYSVEEDTVEYIIQVREKNYIPNLRLVKEGEEDSDGTTKS